MALAANTLATSCPLRLLLLPPLWLTHIKQRNGRIYISGCSEGYSPVVVLRRWPPCVG
ncbi:MAG: hypothetical protein ACR5LG_04260 [Sodalis sp. (in: enterobacteria)]|uniref:hypothetical protein n=1 Tax=Sodalis sp. (in: enterobacteria) TaxID=1898979 RepID=UPI003F3E5F57